MEILVKKVAYSNVNESFHLWGIGDIHLASASCDEDGLRRTVDKIGEDDHALWYSVGDLAEFIARQDIRFRPSSLAPWMRDLEDEDADDILSVEIEHVVNALKPIADKCIGMVYGNHEDKLLARFERNAHREICRKLGTINLGDEALVRLLFERDRHKRALTLYLFHGVTAGRKDGAKVNTLTDMFTSWDVDIIAIGHGHKRVVIPPVITVGLDNRGNYIEKRRYGIMVGGFAKSHERGTSSWASRKGFPPNDVGPVVLTYCPEKHKLTAEV